MVTNQYNQRFHSPDECKSDNHKSYLKGNWREQQRFDEYFDSKFYKWCNKCDPALNK